jgi:CheY-like chemotaxis protein
MPAVTEDTVARREQGGQAAEPLDQPVGRRAGQVGDRTGEGGGEPMPEKLTVLVYSDDAGTREQVILALGRRVHPDLPELEYVEVATEPVVIQQMDTGTIDLAILDGEAVPAGGMGVAKQLKDEIFRCPPLLVVVGRPQDAWLATWSRADAAVSHPIDPLELAGAVSRLVRARLGVGAGGRGPSRG